MRRLFCLFVFVAVLGTIVPCAWGQFLTDEERKGMLSVSVAYSTRDYDMELRTTSPPIEDIDAVLNELSFQEELDSIELTVAWISFGYVELRATVGITDYDLTATHGTDAGYDTALAGSDNLLYGVGTTIRYPLTDEWLVAFDVNFVTGNFDDLDGEVSQLDVVPFFSSRVDDIDWQELTLTPMVLYRYGDFLPYVGARFVNVTSEMTMIVDVPRTGESFDRTIKTKTENELSGVLGLKWRVTPLIMANVEAQLFNNEKITVGVALTF